MKKLKNYFLLASVTALLWACYPGGPSYVEDYDMTFATRIAGSDFSNKAERTYVMPDSVIDISDPDQIGSIPDMNPGTEQAILNQIKARMADYGYEKRPDSHRDTVDYAVFAQRLVSNNWVTYYWGGWCGWYPYWCGGWYPGGTTTYNYQTGTLFVNMINLNNSDTTQGVIDFVWEGGINGLLSSTQANTEKRAIEGVNKMFELSPYLNKN